MKVFCFYVASHIYILWSNVWKSLDYVIYAYIAFFLFISQRFCYHIYKGLYQNIILLIDTIFIMNHNFFRWSHSANVEMVTISCFRNTRSTGTIVCKALCDIFLSLKSGILGSKCQQNVMNIRNLRYQNRMDTLIVEMSTLNSV